MAVRPQGTSPPSDVEFEARFWVRSRRVGNEDFADGIGESDRNRCGVPHLAGVVVKFCQPEDVGCDLADVGFAMLNVDA